MRHRPLCAGLRLTVLRALRRLGLRECVACRFGSGSSHSNRRFPVMLSWGACGTIRSRDGPTPLDIVGGATINAQLQFGVDDNAV